MPAPGYRLQLRLSVPEYQQLQEACRASLHRSLSAYAREKLLDVPMVLRYRDAAMDDVLEELIALRSDLNQCAGDLSRAPRRERQRILLLLERFQQRLDRFSDVCLPSYTLRAARRLPCATMKKKSVRAKP